MVLISTISYSLSIKKDFLDKIGHSVKYSIFLLKVT